MIERFNPWRAVVVSWAVGWVWQLAAYLVLIPRGGLQYGWFKTAAGKLPLLLVLKLPFYGILLAIVGACLLGTVRLWGERRWPTALGLWAFCTIVMIVFTLPSLYIDLQGHGSLFI